MSILTTSRPEAEIRNMLNTMPFGAETQAVSPQGYGTEGDTVFPATTSRVNATKDGVDLNALWDEMQTVLEDFNAHRTAVVSLLSFWTTSIADPLYQGENEGVFEIASEFGEPEALRPPPEHVLMGFDFKDHDRATRFTWKALRAMDARQVRAFHDEALAADNRLVTATILHRLLNPEPTANPENITCYGLWNGNDGLKPPPYRNNTFDDNHSHYLTTGANTIDSKDLEDAVRHIREHGRGLWDSGEQIIALVSERESEVIQSFRANQENENGVKAKYDFIPANNAPPYIIPQGGQLVGSPPPGEVVPGLPSVGVYGPITIVEQNVLPPGYFVVVSTAGANSPTNVVGVRELDRPEYRGLRQIPGRDRLYPLEESYYTRGFGTGVRYRSGAVVMQLGEGDYEVPLVPFMPK